VKDPYLESLLEVLATLEFNPERPHLISVDELRAAGALDVPSAWRNSLGGKRDYHPLFPDDDLPPENPQAAPVDANGDMHDDSADSLLCEESGAQSG
jgi:hypothetical protein